MRKGVVVLGATGSIGKSARSALSFGNWVEASRILGRITDADPNVWGWNDTTALEMRKEAFAVKQLLDACLRAGASMRDDRSGKNLAELKQAASVIARMETQFRENPPAYLEKLLSEARTIHSQINRNLQYLERLEAILARIPAGRFATPEEIAGTALLLCGNAAAYLTGAEIPVAGGMQL